MTVPSDEEDTQGPCHALQARGPERPTEVGTSRTGRGVPWSSLVTATLVQVPESEVTSPGREGRGGWAGGRPPRTGTTLRPAARLPWGPPPPNLGAAATGLGEGRKRPGQLPALPAADLMWTEELPWVTERLGVSLPATPWPPGPHCPGPRASLCCQLASYKSQEYSTCSPHAARVSHVWPRPHKVAEPCLEEGSLQTSSS